MLSQCLRAAAALQSVASGCSCGSSDAASSCCRASGGSANTAAAAAAASCAGLCCALFAAAASLQDDRLASAVLPPSSGCAGICSGSAACGAAGAWHTHSAGHGDVSRPASSSSSSMLLWLLTTAAVAAAVPADAACLPGCLAVSPTAAAAPDMLSAAVHSMVHAAVRVLGWCSKDMSAGVSRGCRCCW